MMNETAKRQNSLERFVDLKVIRT